MSKVDNVVVAAGCLAILFIPLLVSLSLFPVALAWGWTWSLAYDLLIQPFAQLEFGKELPDIGYWAWVCVYVIIGVFHAPFVRPKRASKKGEPVDNAEMIGIFGTRIMSGLMMALVVWMMSIIIF